MPNYLEYQKSISSELISIKDRLRNFIDDHHWPEDGRYKEIILSDILRKHLPKSVSVGTGFIVCEQGLSTQIDIIIYKNDFPLMFQQADFIIATPDAVLGIIEVKSAISTATQLKDAISKLSNNVELIGDNIFAGLFAFQGYDNIEGGQIGRSLQQTLLNSNGKVNHMCIGQNTFIKYWPNHFPTQNIQSAHYSLYKINDLAFGYFISNLVEDIYIAISGQSLPQTLRNVFYPIAETKEHFRVTTVSIPDTQQPSQ